MGGKPDWANQANRPESGGTEKTESLQQSGLLDREKEKFAQDAAEKAANAKATDAGTAPDKES